MTNIGVFERHHKRYDAWFEKNRALFLSELRAIKALMPACKGKKTLVDIGAGTGRFTAELGVAMGIEPAKAMARVAKQRGIKVASGVAEALPLRTSSVDLLLMNTVICFVGSVRGSFKEAFRSLKIGGVLIVAFIDRGSPVGSRMLSRKKRGIFYRDARFYSSEEVAGMLRHAGFKGLKACQTIFKDPSLIKRPQRPKHGFGKGAFVVISARKHGKPPWF